MKQDIQNRADVFKVVTDFYAQVRKDQMLGPIFDAQITEWDAHLEKITGFWYQMLFQVKGAYYGNPIEAHVQVDAHANHEIAPTHFGKWLYYWINTIHDRFEGPMANLMIEHARKMQTVLYLNMFKHKPPTQQ